MKNQSLDEYFIRWIFISAALALVLTGCGGGGGEGGGTVTGTTSYTVGGSVTGLVGSVVLRNNGTDALTISASGTFTFSTKVASGSTYKVTALPIGGQICSVSTGAGTVSGGNVANVLVVCSNNAYTVGGSVTGLNGSMILQDNDGDDLTVTNGNFTFATPVADGSPYNVTELSLQFPNQTCTFSGGSGIIAAANVSNVSVNCVKKAFAYVANNGSDTVSAYAIGSSGALTQIICVGGTVCSGNDFLAGTNPFSVTVDPSGKFAYVANNGSADVSAYTIASTGALIPIICSGMCSGNNFPAGTGPFSVTVDPTGKFVYVANFISNDVSAYNITGTGALIPIICSGTCSGNNFPAGNRPSSVTVDPSGKFAYVTNQDDGTHPGTVSAYTIDGAGALIPIICSGTCSGNDFPAGVVPGSATVGPSGSFAYVANWGSDDVSAYTIDGAGALIPIICSGICSGSNFPAGTLPSSITIDPSGSFAYVANWGSDDVSAYKIASTGELIPIICSGTCSGNNFPAGTGPFSVTVDASGTFAYVANQVSADVSAYTIDGAGALIPIICSGTTCSGNNFPAGTGPISVTTLSH